MRVALLIDGENIGPKYFPEIARQSLALGDLRIARVFADFGDGHRSGWLEHARVYGLRAVMQLSGGKNKNSTDIEITIEAMDILHQGSVDAVVLASSDRDFAPLAQRLRDGGMRVFGIGRKSPAMALAQYCDGYFLIGEDDESKKLTASGDAMLAAPAPAKPAKTALVVSKDELAFLRDLVADLCDGTTSIQPGLVANELHKRNKPLAARIGGKSFLKRLRELDLVDEHGSGPTKTISPKRSA